MGFWSYYYTAANTAPVLGLAVEISEAFNLQLQNTISGAAETGYVSSWYLFKQTMVIPNLIMALFLFFMFVFLPWMLIKLLPVFKANLSSCGMRRFYD